MSKRKISFEGLTNLPFEEWEFQEMEETKIKRESPYKNVEIPQKKKSWENDDQIIYYFLTYLPTN